MRKFRRVGECYILANETVTLKDMCEMLHKECNAKKIKFYLPLDLADKIAQGLIGANTEPTPVHLTREEIRESGVMPDMIRAMEHDVSGVPTVDPVEVYKNIESGVVGAYKNIETGVVDAYKAVEDTFVGAYRKVEDTMVDKLFRKEGETVEEAKERLRK